MSMSVSDFHFHIHCHGRIKKSLGVGAVQYIILSEVMITIALLLREGNLSRSSLVVVVGGSGTIYI